MEYGSRDAARRVNAVVEHQSLSLLQLVFHKNAKWGENYDESIITAGDNSVGGVFLSRRRPWSKTETGWV